MKYSILLVLLLIVSLNASAQMFSGRVLDDQKIPVQYATVALLSVADSSLISGTVTDEQGIFKIEVSESKPICWLCLMWDIKGVFRGLCPLSSVIS